MPTTPPISHYKDETQDILDKEINKEIEKAQVSEQTPELKVLPVKKEEKKPTNTSSIVSAFRQKLSSSTTPIELPGLGKTVEFKEISTREQKEMSKVALQSNSRPDIMYCTMVSLINELAADKDFDIRELTEFERIQVTVNLQQMNKINPEIKYTCSQCGKETTYKLDTAKMLRSFTKTFKPEQEFKIENGNRTFVFNAGWSKCGLVEDFFKNYYKKYDNQSKAIKESIDNMSQIEYMLMFLKSVTLVENSDPDDTLTANLEEMTYGERCQIIDSIPQSVLFDENVGVISKIIKHYIEPMQAVFKYKDCPFCGAEQDGAVASLADFLGG